MVSKEEESEGKVGFLVVRLVISEACDRCGGGGDDDVFSC